MNIDFIKSEIAKLSQLVASWNDVAEIPAIEKDLLLQKLQSLYEAVRFDTVTTVPCNDAAQSLAALATAAASDVNESTTDEEPEIEVEFLFDEDENTADIDTQEEDTIDETEVEEDSDIVPIITSTDEVTDEAPVPADEDSEDISDEEAEDIAPEENSDDVEEQPNTEIAPEPQIAETEKTEAVETPKEVEPIQPTLGNLFGNEVEPKRTTRSKHLRMMSLYNDAEPKTKEKSVDISKIFDLGFDDIAPAPKTEVTEQTVVAPTIADNSEQNITLADAIAPNTQTLADTISRPAPLVEEITSSKIETLHNGVGINDQFLMIRDLFDGDKAAYEKAIADLDAQESFDDCMIYIVENFAWNPDSEGAKFIMKLLERKHS